MAYSPNNNPYAAGDPYMYDLEWQVQEILKLKAKTTYLETAFTTPIAVNTAAELTDANKVYIYVGNEPGYLYGHWYYYDKDSQLWKDGGLYGAFDLDTALSLTSENAVQNKVITRKCELIDASIYGLTSKVSTLSSDFNSFKMATNNKIDLIDASLVNHEGRIETLEETKLTGRVVIASAGDRTIPGNGFVSITDIKPSGTILGAWIRTYSAISPAAAINVTGEGNFLFGAPNTTVTGLQIGFLVV